MGVASVLRCMPFVRPSPSLCPSRFFGEFFEDTFHATLHERLSFSIHLSHVCRPLFPSCCCFFLLSDFFLFLLHLFFSLLPSSVLLHFGLFVELLHGVGSCVAFSLAWMGMFIHLLGWVQFRIVVASIFLSLVWFHGRLGVCTADVRRSCMFLRLFLLDLFTVRWRVPSFFSQQFSILDFPHEVSIPFLFQRCRPRMRRSHVRPSESYRGTRTCPFIVVDVVRTFPMSRVSSLFLRAMVFVCFSFGTCAHILRWSSLFRFFSRGCCSSPPTPIGLILVFFSFLSIRCCCCRRCFFARFFYVTNARLCLFVRLHCHATPFLGSYLLVLARAKVSRSTPRWFRSRPTIHLDTDPIERYRCICGDVAAALVVGRLVAW